MMRFYGIVFFTFIFSQFLNAQCPITVDAGDDIYLCTPPTPTQINGSITGDYINFTWSPTTGLTGINTLTPTVNVTQNSTYVLTGRGANLSNNLIENLREATQSQNTINQSKNKQSTHGCRNVYYNKNRIVSFTSLSERLESNSLTNLNCSTKNSMVSCGYFL
jgi:hypothetical protein